MENYEKTMSNTTGSETPPTSPSFDVDNGTPPGVLEPIAVVGMGCRLPGGASDPQRLWEKLAGGQTAWTPGPGDRFNMKAFHSPGKYNVNTTNTLGGHFLDGDIAAWDAPFFGIHPVEASAIDPQQRLLLEVAYEAFENAGITTEELWGSKTGVYVGQWASDYHEILSRDTQYPPTYQTTGIGPAISSNRISYYFNLHGPSFTVDTGCSSSFVALHAAVQSLRTGETDMGFVGGVNLLLDPQRYTYQSRLRMFSHEGRSFAFDHRANGYGRGEGCTGVVLKPLTAALRDGNHVRAVIRNVVVNQDGRTNGISVPSGRAQEQAIRRAYGEAGLELHADYVEAHGTGTALGDPIEVQAIAAALSVGRSTENALPIGSIKANIGHTESAAGLAGLVKAILMLEKGAIPPQANFEKANDKILFADWGIRVPLSLEPRALSRISVNSFGYGGTNAHVVVEAMPDGQIAPAKGHTGGILLARPQHWLFVFSSSSEKSCQRSANNLAQYLAHYLGSAESGSGSDDGEPYRNVILNQLAYTLSRRTMLNYRAAVVASSVEDLIGKFSELAQMPIPASGFDGRNPPRIGFVFTGQGAQYHNMGRELIAGNWKSFTASLDRANRHLATLGCEWDVMTELSREKEVSDVDDPELGQPLTTAIQLALVDLLADLGILPCVVAGHSSGEVSAAYCAKVLSFEDAMTVSYHRGRLTGHLMKQLKQNEQGAMLAVGATPKEVSEFIRDMGALSDQVSIACYNSPSSVTISGSSVAIDHLKKFIDQKGVFNRILRTKGAAYHSPQMHEIEKEYRKMLEDIEPRPPVKSVTMVSSLTGKDVTENTIDRDYWARNLVSPVLFTDAMKNMCREPRSSQAGDRRVDVIVEVGPHPQLSGPIKQTLTSSGDSKEIVYSGTLDRKKDAEEAFLGCLGFLFRQGMPFDLAGANNRLCRKRPGMLIDLPPYPFDHDRAYWHESRLSKNYRHRQFLPHELLGSLSPYPNQVEPRWRHYLRLKDLPWLKSHAVQGQTVFPAAGYLVMAVEAARQHAAMRNNLNGGMQISKFVFRNVSIGKALILSDGGEGVGELEIALSLRPQPRTAKESSSQWSEFRVFTVNSAEEWSEHCRGLVSVELLVKGGLGSRAAGEEDDLGALAHEADGEGSIGVSEDDKKFAISRSIHSVTPKKLYYQSRELGLDWQPPFQNLVSIKTGSASCWSVVESPERDYATVAGQIPPYVIHPATLDACLFQGLCSVLVLEDGIGTTVVPTFIESITLSGQHHDDRPGKRFNCYTARRDSPLTFDIAVGETATGQEQLVLQATGVRVSTLPGSTALGRQPRELCHTINWVAYCDAMTEKYRNAVCKKMLDPVSSSVVEQNHVLDVVVLAHIQRAVQDISVEEIQAGPRRHWFEWARSHIDDKYDTNLLPHNDNSGSAVDLGILGQTIGRLGPQLASIWKGTVDPLALLTQDNLLSRLYSEERCPRCYVQISAYIRELGMQNPGMKVLEVGAGTASASLSILKAVGGRESGSGPRLVSTYDFTDVSPGFFEAARERLSDYADFTNYRVLDIEKDVDGQGFQKASYDLVVACNVVHATRRIDNTLEHVKSLLKPGGRLILMEITKDQLYYSLIFGAFPGWWAGHEEGRKLSPLLGISEWTKKLAQHGLDQIEDTFHDFEESDGRTLSVFIAKTPEAPSVAQALFTTKIEILFESVETPGLRDFASQLSQNLGGQEVALCRLRDTTDPEKESGNISILLPDIAESLASGLLRGCWQAFQRRILSSSSILWTTSGGSWGGERPNAGIVSGFARSFRLEHPEIRLVTLDLDPTSETPDWELMARIIPTMIRSPSFDPERLYGEVEVEFAERAGQLYVPRVFHHAEMSRYVHQARGLLEPELGTFLGSDRTLTAELGVPGLLETLRWKEDHTSAASLGPDEIRLELRAASINFKDVLIAAGQIEGLTEMSNDCSGVVIAVGANMAKRFQVGDRVCALYSRSYTNYPVVHGDCCHVVPESLSFEEAASLPIVWTTVYHALVDMGRLGRDATVLIHSAAGAVGQAAIMLAHHLGAQVFATAGTSAKRRLLVERYGIAEDHVFSSRTTAFRRDIAKATGGRGVDVVLNSTSGEMFRESCNAIAPFGRFVEIGRKDFMDDALMPTNFLLRNVTFSYVDLTLIIESNKPLVRRLLEEVVQLMETGAIRPVTLTTMPISDIEAAFRQIQAGKHIGKIVLTVEEEQQVKLLPPPPQPAQLRPDGLYIVIGGLGGLGQAIVSWMADRGARTIMTISRSGARSDQAVGFIDEMRSRGVTVIGQKCDVCFEEDLRALFSRCGAGGDLPPLCGLIQSAMVLEDSIFEDMSHDQWASSIQPKIQGTWNLHRMAPPNLDFFIILSSAVAISGNVGQTNYAAACSFQDALAQYRRSRGMPAYSINIGAVVEAGFVSENPEVAASLRRQGLGTVKVPELLSLLNYAVTNEGVDSPVDSQCSIGLTPGGDEAGLGQSIWMTDVKFRHLARHRDATASASSGGSSDILDAIGTTADPDEAVDLVCQAILQHLGKLITAPVDSLSASKSLDHYGVDSLVAVELRNWIGAYLQANVPLLVLRGTGSVKELAKVVAKESRLLCFNSL